MGEMPRLDMAKVGMKRIMYTEIVATPTDAEAARMRPQWLAKSVRSGDFAGGLDVNSSVSSSLERI